MAPLMLAWLGLVRFESAAGALAVGAGDAGVRSTGGGVVALAVAAAGGGGMLASGVAGAQAANNSIAGTSIGMARGMVFISTVLRLAGYWRHRRQ